MTPLLSLLIIMKNTIKQHIRSFKNLILPRMIQKYPKIIKTKIPRYPTVSSFETEAFFQILLLRHGCC